MTDRQQRRVYAAERSWLEFLEMAGDSPVINVAGSTIVTPVNRRIGEWEGFQRYVDLVESMPWYPVPEFVPHVTVVDRMAVTKDATKRRNMAHYRASDCTIAIPRVQFARNQSWTWDELTVLHELAHHLTSCLEPGVESHGPEYAGWYVWLVERAMSPEAALLLRVCMDETGAKVYMPVG